jgi:hypothetical protein
MSRGSKGHVAFVGSIDPVRACECFRIAVRRLKENHYHLTLFDGLAP